MTMRGARLRGHASSMSLSSSLHPPSLSLRKFMICLPVTFPCDISVLPDLDLVRDLITALLYCF